MREIRVMRTEMFVASAFTVNARHSQEATPANAHLSRLIFGCSGFDSGNVRRRISAQSGCAILAGFRVAEREFRNVEARG